VKTPFSRLGPITSLGMASLLALSGPPAAAKEQWTCTLDLHQGDRGSLSFVAAESGISGETAVQRGDTEMRHRISGSWKGDRVSFRRDLGGGTVQDFVGISVRTEGGDVKMAGRFAHAFAGVWSADCQLERTVSGPEPQASRRQVLRDRKERMAREPVRAGVLALDRTPPKVSVKVDGILVRTVGDSIDFRATAEDEGKLSSVTLFVDGRAVRTCNVWDCPYRLTAEKPGKLRAWATAKDAAGNEGRSEEIELMVHPTDKPGPALTIRTQPYEPTTADRVRFIASGSHSTGVESITIHVGGRAVKTCRAASCEFVGGPYRAGVLQWRISARSLDGGETYGHENELRVTAAPASGSCVLTGRAVGPRADVADVFFANIYGPDDKNLFRETAHFDRSGSFHSSGLPDGEYWLVLDTRGDLAVGVEPRQRTVRCSGGKAPEIVFELR
jgi:hypothetical protein